MWPLGANGSVDHGSIINQTAYRVNEGKSITHIVNGMAGNIESHSEFSKGQGLTNITALLDTKNYGFSQLTVKDNTTVTWEFIKGDGSGQGDFLTLTKE